MYPSYTKFCEARVKGLRPEANQLTADVVRECRADPKEAFIIELCQDAEGQRINHHLWQEIVFPFAKARMEDNVVAIQCLVLTVQNLYADKAKREELGDISEEQLLRKNTED